MKTCYRVAREKNYPMIAMTERSGRKNKLWHSSLDINLHLKTTLGLSRIPHPNADGDLGEFAPRFYDKMGYRFTPGSF